LLEVALKHRPELIDGDFHDVTELNVGQHLSTRRVGASTAAAPQPAPGALPWHVWTHLLI
jgi:hypothetical protein